MAIIERYTRHQFLTEVIMQLADSPDWEDDSEAQDNLQTFYDRFVGRFSPVSFEKVEEPWKEPCTIDTEDYPGEVYKATGHVSIGLEFYLVHRTCSPPWDTAQACATGPGALEVIARGTIAPARRFFASLEYAGENNLYKYHGEEELSRTFRPKVDPDA